MNKKQVIEALKQLQQGNIPVKSSGICHNIKVLINEVSNQEHSIWVSDICLFLKPYFETWKYFSGDQQYPVPDTSSGLTARQLFIRSNNLWENEQLELRMDLVEHLLKELNKPWWRKLWK